MEVNYAGMLPQLSAQVTLVRKSHTEPFFCA
jgi:hypothetical protein